METPTVREDLVDLSSAKSRPQEPVIKILSQLSTSSTVTQQTNSNMPFLTIITRSNGKNQRTFFFGKRRPRVTEKQSSHSDDCEATTEFSVVSDDDSSSLGDTAPATNTNMSLLDMRHEEAADKVESAEERTRRRRELLNDNCDSLQRALALYRNGDLDFDSDSESSDEEDEDEIFDNSLSSLHCRCHCEDDSDSESSFEDDDGNYLPALE
jgi:hypothetical protein